MANLFFDSYSESMDFLKNDFNPKIQKIRSYNLSSNKINDELIEALRTKILRLKGDWISSKSTYFNDNYYVQINLLFHHKELTPDDKKLIKNICSELDNFFKELNLIQYTEINYNNADKLTEIFEAEGFVLSISEQDGGGILDSKEVEEIFKFHDIQFETVSISKSRFDGGASGGSEELIYFIANSIVSGITWDVIKPILAANLKSPIDYFRVVTLDNFKFKKMRGILAERLREEEVNIVLIKLHKGNEQIKITFKAGTKTIHVTCDHGYIIKDLKVEDDVA